MMAGGEDRVLAVVLLSAKEQHDRLVERWVLEVIGLLDLLDGIHEHDVIADTIDVVRREAGPWWPEVCRATEVALAARATAPDPEVLPRVPGAHEPPEGDEATQLAEWERYYGET